MTVAGKDLLLVLPCSHGIDRPDLPALPELTAGMLQEQLHIRFAEDELLWKRKP